MSREKGKASKLGRHAPSEQDRLLVFQFGDLFDKHPDACRIAQRVALAYSVLATETPPGANEKEYAERANALVAEVSIELFKFVLDAMHATAKWQPKKGTNEPVEIHPLRDLGEALERAVKPRDVPRAFLTMLGQWQAERLVPLRIPTALMAALEKAIKEGAEVESTNAELKHHIGDFLRHLDARKRTLKDEIADGSIKPNDLRKLFEKTPMKTTDRRFREWLRDAGFPKGGKGGRPKKK